MQINGWTIIAHPLFAAQFNDVVAAVEEAKRKDPGGYKNTPNAKLLADIVEITARRIPADPTDKRYWQGKTLGDDYKHWFRDKFGNGRFRLFFRYDGKSKVIAYAWVNNDKTLRTYGAKSDAYAVFKKMLDEGNPPDSWQKLMSECIAMDALLEIGKALSHLE
jgi:toxin YhaV